MSFASRKNLLVLGVFSLFVTATLGCGGTLGSPCGGADWGSFDPAAQGDYSARYVPAGVGEKTLNFEITIGPSGSVTGEMTEAGVEGSVAVTGDMLNWYYPCSDNQSYLSLTFTPSGGVETTLAASRKLSDKPAPWTYTATLANRKGTLTLTKR